MHAYPIDIELVRFAFLLGIVVSMFMYERYGLTPGSLIVAGYIGIFVGEPIALGMTLGNALLSHVVMTRVVPRFGVVYGSSRFAILLVVSVGIQSLALLASFCAPAEIQALRSGPLLAGVGFVVPALMAHDMRRQGVRKTMVACAGTGLLVVGVVWTIALANPSLMDSQTALDPGLAYDPRALPAAALFSVLGATSMRLRYGLRSAGIIGAAYVALVVNQPLSLLALLGTGALSYVIVRWGIMPFGIVFGRRKFALMLMVGAMCGWFVAIAGDHVLPNSALAFRWCPIVGLLVPGLLGNDFESAGLKRTLTGLALSVSFVLPATLLTSKIVIGSESPRLAILVPWAAIATSVVLGPHLYAMFGRHRAVVAWRSHPLSVLRGRTNAQLSMTSGAK